jgi:hypothetical protein
LRIETVRASNSSVWVPLAAIWTAFMCYSAWGMQKRLRRLYRRVNDLAEEDDPTVVRVVNKRWSRRKRTLVRRIKDVGNIHKVCTDVRVDRFDRYFFIIELYHTHP